MPLFTRSQLTFVQAISNLVHANPFLAEREEFVHKALGKPLAPGANQVQPTDPQVDPNLITLQAKCTELLTDIRQKMDTGITIRKGELQLYEDLAYFTVYHEFREYIDDTIWQMLDSPNAKRVVPYFGQFRDRLDHFLLLPNHALPLGYDVGHTLALFFQVRRAYFHIDGCLVGRSAPAVHLRAKVWQSIFTHDMRRYRRTLFDRMGQYTTLITGPSGTGKELVARSIALSRYIPFDAATAKFAEDFSVSFIPINLSALSPTLIESELFGHKRDSFTGAVGDRTGWLEACPPTGTVFLDEIGDLDPLIQVKLLRVLQTRSFNRLGATDERSFSGKLIAATNRDLAQAMADGQFRQDFFYRLCGDQITTPSLAEQLADRPEDLRTLVHFLAQRLVGDAEAGALTEQVVDWIDLRLGDAYPWPGNVRELEQCVRNILVRSEYHPQSAIAAHVEPRQQLAAQFTNGELSADRLLDAYCTLAYARTGSYAAAAEQLAVDRRTIKSRLDSDLLSKLRSHEP